MNHANLATPKQWQNIWHGPEVCSSVVLCCLFVSHTLGTRCLIAICINAQTAALLLQNDLLQNGCRSKQQHPAPTIMPGGLPPQYPRGLMRFNTRKWMVTWDMLRVQLLLPP